ncbi:hypothetical protein IKH83_02405 [Candidatus Saccharibacteria bacterium]|nr:hypothetical protein [Candidatus Saccharibacteria bacterium]
MKKLKIIVAAFAVGLATVWSPAVMAWGPERQTYTMESPAPHATFNSITDNPILGDERDFVRVAEDDGTYANEVELEDGKIYMVYIGYHNDAASSTNETGEGISKNTRVVTDFPKQIAAGEKGTIYAKILSDTAEPHSVWDEAYITAKEDLKIEYIPGTALIHNDWDLDGTELPASLFTAEGALIGVNEANGTVYGCAEFSGYVIYRFKVYKEEIPEELPKTGPAEAIMAVAIVVGICGGAFYLYRTRRALKKTTASVMNEPVDMTVNEPKEIDQDKHDNAGDAGKE